MSATVAQKWQQGSECGIVNKRKLQTKNMYLAIWLGVSETMLTNVFVM